MRTVILPVILAISLVACQDNPPIGPDVQAPPIAYTSQTEPAVAIKPYAGPPQLDIVTPGDAAGEERHNHKGQNDETGDWSERTYRHSVGGWFSWDLKVLPDHANELRVTYWGSDVRTFDIQIDDTKLITERINNDKPEEFFEKWYAIPAALTRGKEKITVKFVAPGAEEYAGGVFGLRTMYAIPATRPKAP